MYSPDTNETILFIVVLFLLVYTIRYHRRKRKQDWEQNQALFKQRKREHRQQAPPTISLLTLSQRQLADWEQQLSTMEKSSASTEQIRYCRQQIERFRQEVAWLKEQS